MEKNEEQLYLHLGLAATQFARLESQLRNLLVLEIYPANFMVGFQTIEENTLFKNMQLLRKINPYTGLDPDRVKNVLDRIDKVRKMRNSFIHGNWGKPIEKEGEILIEVHEPKLSKIKIGNFELPSNATVVFYTVSEIKNQIEELKSISAELMSLYESIEGRVFGNEYWNKKPQ